MAATQRRTLDLAGITLEKGAHNPDHTFCVMEAAAYVAGEPWSDAPTCVSPVIAAFLRNWNDSVNDTFRQRLKPYIERVLDTKTTVKDETTRTWMATDWLARVQAPAWLELAGLKDRAGEMRNLPPLTSQQIAVAVQATTEKARVDAAAARDAAEDVARDAAGAAAWAAARDGARAAANKHLAPTVAQLQESAFDLLDRLIVVGRTATV